MFQRFPRHFQENPLLGIRRLRLAWRDAEKLGIETGDVGDEAAPLRRHPARHRGVGIIEFVGIPAIGRHLADSVPAADQEIPIALRPDDAAGQAATHPDERDRLRSDRRHRGPDASEFPGKELTRLRRQLGGQLGEIGHGSSVPFATCNSLAATTSESRAMSVSDSAASRSDATVVRG